MPVSPSRRPLTRAAFTLLALSCCSLSAKVIFEETFADEERMHLNPPDSLEWYTSSSASTLEVTTDGLRQNGGGRQVLAHFTPEGKPLELEVGQKLVLSLQFSVEGPTDSPGGLRIGLLNSHGAHAFDDKMNSAMEYEGYRGYIALTNPAPAKRRQIRLGKRTGNGDRLLSTTQNFTMLPSSGGELLQLESGQIYTAELSVTRTAAKEVSVSISFTGSNGQTGVFTRTDSKDIETAFDSLAISPGSKTVSAFTIHQARLDLLPSS
ncbi:hypothetical protein [Actomonas aquatica]|uniref:Alginate lyase 2 domain-containing protein n=1 Tax=Actomonas aquatica TaxID=2866162 RepID=A0ABZ1C9I1_9BACT|nr:hypothetical protein [Opitutus sp. WL0086]WRQ87878.1 hypothetical protein K1X11_000555 [Opitutus sp. WL0086]